MSSEELRLFDKVRVFLDEDYSSAENFTALGNFYFIHESLSDALIWDFAAMAFVSAKGKEIHSGNIESVTTKEKSKFPQNFFPECKWSRKGFLRTRWSLNGTVFDLINIHLFHDASNFIAMESFPSVYSKNRRRALEHTLERFHNDSYGTAPFFVFGDFNFRTDTKGVINKLADGLIPVRVQSNKNNEQTKLQYKDDSSQVVLSLGKKEFSHADHQSLFLDENGLWLKEFDREMEAFAGRLFEFAIAFPPSYPFEEDEKGGNNYMKTRCPAWCDRVILSNTAKNLVNNVSDTSSVEYGLMGPSTRMGDHKPVYLKMDLINDAGTVSCCTPCDTSSSDKRVMCFGNVTVCEPASWSCRSLSLKQGGSAPSSALTLKLDTSAAALAADCFLAPPHASLLHEPYTPESMETPSSSPIPIRIQRDFEEIGDVEWKCGVDEEDEEISPANINKKSICHDISEKSTNNEELQSGIQSVPSSNNLISVHDLEYPVKDSSNKCSPDSVVYNNSGMYKDVYQGVPHVLICYLDMQVCDMKSSGKICNTKKTNEVDPNFSNTSEVASQKESHAEYSQEISHETQMKKCSSSKFSDVLIQERSNVCPPISVSCPGHILTKIDHAKMICDENIITSLAVNPLSSGSDNLHPLSTAIHSLNSQNLKNECERGTEISSCPAVSNYVARNEFIEDLKSEIIQNASQNDEKFSEGTLATNHIDSCRHMRSHSHPINASNKNIKETKNIPTDHNTHIMPTTTTTTINECTKIYERSGSNVEFLPIKPHQCEIDLESNKENSLREKNTFSIDSQDCINVISTEISSQVKRTKEHIAKDTKLKESSKRKSTDCCYII